MHGRVCFTPFPEQDSEQLQLQLFKARLRKWEKRHFRSCGVLAGCKFVRKHGFQPADSMFSHRFAPGSEQLPIV